MPTVMYLPETFYDDFTAATELLKQELSWDEYEYFYRFLKRTKLVAATRYLEDVYEERAGDINPWKLAQACKQADSKHDFHKTVDALLGRWESFEVAISTWFHLMEQAGGAKNATKLIKKQRQPFIAPEPVEWLH